MSDHWPVTGSVKGSRIVQDGPRVQREKFVVGGDVQRGDGEEPNPAWSSLVDSNYWEPLLEDDEDDIDAFAESFVRASKKVAEAAGVLQRVDDAETRGIERRNCSSSKHVRAVKRKLRGHRAWRRAPAALREQRRQEYAHACRMATFALREARKKSWLKMVNLGAGCFKADPHKFWRFMIGLSGRRNRQVNARAVQPIKDEQGNVLVDAEQIKARWSRHYAALARDETKHSRSRRHWRGLMPRRPQRKVPRCASQALSAPLEWAEVCETLGAMKKGKAPGDDGIPVEFLRLVIERKVDGEWPGEPQTVMGRALLRVLSRIWDDGRIPTVWAKSVVVSIPKKGGDLQLPDSYRGISLISCVVKVLATILARRLSSTLEAHGVLRKEQAGFRTREECPAQAAALYELLKRRMATGERSYLAFIDFRKAYDTVPQEALFRKLRWVGVRGKALKFIRGLYNNSLISVRVGESLAPAVKLDRGVRQG